MNAGTKPLAGDLVAFPMCRHGRDGVLFVTSVAAKMMAMPPTSAEKHLVRQLSRKTETLRRRGFDEATIKAERNKAEAAIRAALWKAIFQGGAA